MKQDIHPSNYREVVFKDMSNDEIFITRSTVAAKIGRASCRERVYVLV